MFNQLGVIGCGLMGGSFALALKRAGLVKRVIGYSKSPSTTERAKKLGVIDVAAESALLAAAIVNPRLLNPARPTPRLIRRQQLILRRMGAVVPPQESAQLER